jgi:hypothetical protein
MHLFEILLWKPSSLDSGSFSVVNRKSPYSSVFSDASFAAPRPLRFCLGEPSVPQSDQEIFQSARRELFSAVIGDVMDKMGPLRQFLPPAIVPLDQKTIRKALEEGTPSKAAFEKYGIQ